MCIEIILNFGLSKIRLGEIVKDVFGGKNSRSDENWKIATVETLEFQVSGSLRKCKYLET